MKKKTHPLSGFCRVGALEPFEAKRMIPRLEQERIRFRLHKNWREIQQMDPLTASNWAGTLGAGAKVTLLVHRDDQEKFSKILLEFFPV